MGKLLCLVLAGTLFLGPLAARKPNKRDVDFFILEEIFPHITFGGPWSTTVTLLNIEDLLAVFPLRFWTTDGQPWQVFVEGVGTSSEFTVTLPPGGSIDIVLPSPGPDVETGWAEIEQPLETTVAGHAIFTDRTEGRSIFEAVVPLGTSVDDQFFLLFDNTNFNNTCMALANPSGSSPTTVTLDFGDQGANRILLTTITLGARNQTAFCFVNQFPQLVGRKGVLQVTGSELSLSALAFRFNPDGAFTTFVTMSRGVL